MYKFCVFGGTTEGRRLTELLSTLPCETTVCVATDYGQTLLPESEHLTVSAKNSRSMRSLPCWRASALTS